MALQKGVAQSVGIICYDGETPTAPVDLDPAALIGGGEGRIAQGISRSGRC